MVLMAFRNLLFRSKSICGAARNNLGLAGAVLCMCSIALVGGNFALADSLDNSTWYLGAQTGWEQHQNACAEQALACDDSASIFGLYAGYEFLSRWQLEASYLNPGKVTALYPRLATDPLTVSGESDALDLSLLYSLPLANRLQLQLRAGAAYWQAKSSSSEFAYDSDGVSASAGAAFEWLMNESWAGRLGYQYIHDIGDENTGGANVQFFSLGLRYRFNASDTPSTSASAVPAVGSTSVIYASRSSRTFALQQVVLFEFDRDYTSQLGQLAAIVSRLKEIPHARVELTGYSDARGASDYNRQLSQRRAEFVAGYLHSHGISRARVAVLAQGESELTTDLGQATDDSASRRVLVRLIETEAATGGQP